MSFSSFSCSAVTAFIIWSVLLSQPLEHIEGVSSSSHHDKNFTSDRRWVLQSSWWIASICIRKQVMRIEYRKYADIHARPLDKLLLCLFWLLPYTFRAFAFAVRLFSATHPHTTGGYTIGLNCIFINWRYDCRWIVEHDWLILYVKWLTTTTTTNPCNGATINHEDNCKVDRLLPHAN